MKPLYEDSPDQDDLLLQQSIQDGTVPPGCRLGGAIVQGLSAAGGDPCGKCDVKRDICGGRPRAPEGPPTSPFGFDAEKKHQTSINDSATARKHQRKLTITQLNRMIKEKE